MSFPNECNQKGINRLRHEGVPGVELQCDRIDLKPYLTVA